MKQLKIATLVIATIFTLAWFNEFPFYVSSTIGVLGCLLIFASVTVFEKRLLNTEDRQTIFELQKRVDVLEDRVKSLSSVANLREVVRSAGK